jgi:FkbM family methyltransferase
VTDYAVDLAVNRKQSELKLMRSDGITKRSRAERAFDEARFALRKSLVVDVDVSDEPYTHTFCCENPSEIARAVTLNRKEPGTIEWIRLEVGSGDVFYDIGANIGVYTLPAARRVGPSGTVYAFEPHLANAQSLLKNVGRNGLGEAVEVMTCALSDHDGFLDFAYSSLRPGDFDALDEEKASLTPLFSELKHSATVDGLIETEAIRPPNLVKIDVDGTELAVVKGMSELLLSENRPRALQVEINPRVTDELPAYLEEHGFTLSQRHISSGTQRQIAAGADPETVIYNAIYRPQ